MYVFLEKCIRSGKYQKLQFVLYKMNGSKAKKQGVYEMKPKAGKKNISIKVANEDKGKFKLVVYAYTAWGKSISERRDLSSSQKRPW